MFSIVKIFQKNETLRHLNQLKIHMYINQNGRIRLKEKSI